MSTVTPHHRRVEVPLIDVVLPVRNFGRFLGTSIPSILAQSERRFRIIAVDYGSSDDTLEILDGFARRDARVTILRLSGDHVLTEALIAGCAHARAPFIARQDADDISLPERFACQIAAFERDPAIVAISGSCRHIDASGRLTGSRFVPGRCDDVDCRALPAREPPLLQPFLMMRREAYLRCGGYRRAFDSFSEDSDLFWRLSTVGRLVNLDLDLGLMRVHAASLTNASIVNARLLAVHSQLAALSARRRVDREPDIDLPQLDQPSMRKARSLEGMLRVASRIVRPSEIRHLEAASAVKLLEIAAVRLIELEIEDCLYIRWVYDLMSNEMISGRCVANWAMRTSVVRLLRQNLLAHALALTSPGRLARIAALRLLPTRYGVPLGQ